MEALKNKKPEILKRAEDRLTIEKWLKTFIDKNDPDREHVFEINYEGTLHFMDFETVVNSIVGQS